MANARQVPPLPSARSQEFWIKAADIGGRLLAPHDGERLPAQGAAHFVAEFADCLLAEFERRFGPQRPEGEG